MCFGVQGIKVQKMSKRLWDQERQLMIFSSTHFLVFLLFDKEFNLDSKCPEDAVISSLWYIFGLCIQFIQVRFLKFQEDFLCHSVIGTGLNIIWAFWKTRHGLHAICVVQRCHSLHSKRFDRDTGFKTRKTWHLAARMKH